MYCIYWTDRHTNQLIGTLDSILTLANMLENSKLDFHVSDTRGFQLNQKSLGCGGFQHWLERGYEVQKERSPKTKQS